jgi:hypothetical protein
VEIRIANCMFARNDYFQLVHLFIALFLYVAWGLEGEGVQIGISDCG